MINRLSHVEVAVTDLGRRTGHMPATPGRALDFEKERALRALGQQPRRPDPRDRRSRY